MESGTPIAGEQAPLAPTRSYDNPIDPQLQPIQAVRPVDRTSEDLPTDSHALAAAEPEEKGYAQTHSASSVRDLGWHNDSGSIPRPLIAGLPNDDLWVLLRRFNKVILFPPFLCPPLSLTRLSKSNMSRQHPPLPWTPWI